MADPHDPDHDERDEERRVRRPLTPQRVRQRTLFGVRDLQVQDEEGDCDREDTIAERLESLRGAARDLHHGGADLALTTVTAIAVPLVSVITPTYNRADLV